IEVSKEIVAIKKRTEVKYNEEIVKINNKSEDEIILGDKDLN
ncbi:23497_t:CDS:1, partial [Cetraspora pellucida]